jgi:hypothetical protein
MIWVTDTINKHKVAINPQYVVAVFQIIAGPDPTKNEHVGKTAVNLTTGTIIVEESELDVVGMMVSK